MLHNYLSGNNLEIEFGVLSPGAEARIMEGESITFTVGFIKDDVLLDDDFIMGYSVSILLSDNNEEFGNATSKQSN